MTEIPENVREIIIKALHQYKGDNHIRAERAFAGLSDEEMEKEHGQSGRTRRQWLQGYKAHAARVDMALVWIKALR